MSRQAAPLPPRCPFQKKPNPRQIHHEPVSLTPQKDPKQRPRHHKSPSQSSILDEQPPWFDDLLKDPDSNSKSKPTAHRRSASDSGTILNIISLNDEGSSMPNETSNGLESDCVYGPNSPRKKGESSFSENSIVSAFSEYVSQNTFQYIDGSVCISGSTLSESKNDACGSVGELNAEAKAKRHSGQRSRVRKLQYIAELERTVNVFETLESELAARVASLLQQRVILSMENSNLKQQLSTLQLEKIIMDGEHQSLRNEVERLKMSSTIPKRKAKTYFGTTPAVDSLTGSNALWQMLDIQKLSLKDNTIMLDHGFRS